MGDSSDASDVDSVSNNQELQRSDQISGFSDVRFVQKFGRIEYEAEWYLNDETKTTWVPEDDIQRFLAEDIPLQLIFDDFVNFQAKKLETVRAKKAKFEASRHKLRWTYEDEDEGDDQPEVFCGQALEELQGETAKLYDPSHKYTESELALLKLNTVETGERVTRSKMRGLKEGSGSAESRPATPRVQSRQGSSTPSSTRGRGRGRGGTTATTPSPVSRPNIRRAPGGKRIRMPEDDEDETKEKAESDEEDVPVKEIIIGSDTEDLAADISIDAPSTSTSEPTPPKPDIPAPLPKRQQAAKATNSKAKAKPKSEPKPKAKKTDNKTKAPGRRTRPKKSVEIVASSDDELSASENEPPIKKPQRTTRRAAAAARTKAKKAILESDSDDATPTSTLPPSAPAPVATSSKPSVSQPPPKEEKKKEKEEPKPPPPEEQMDVSEPGPTTSTSSSNSIATEPPKVEEPPKPKVSGTERYKVRPEEFAKFLTDDLSLGLEEIFLQLKSTREQEAVSKIAGLVSKNPKFSMQREFANAVTSGNVDFVKDCVTYIKDRMPDFKYNFVDPIDGKNLLHKISIVPCPGPNPAQQVHSFCDISETLIKQGVKLLCRVSRLLMCCAPVNIQPAPLTLAADTDQLEIFKLLLDHGASIHDFHLQAVRFVNPMRRKAFIEVLKKHEHSLRRKMSEARRIVFTNVSEEMAISPLFISNLFECKAETVFEFIFTPDKVVPDKSFFFVLCIGTATLGSNGKWHLALWGGAPLAANAILNGKELQPLQHTHAEPDANGATPKSSIYLASPKSGENRIVLRFDQKLTTSAASDLSQCMHCEKSKIVCEIVLLKRLESTSEHPKDAGAGRSSMYF